MPAPLNEHTRYDIEQWMYAGWTTKDIMARSGVSQVQIDRMRQNILDWGNVVAPTFGIQGRPRKLDENMEVELLAFLRERPAASLADMVQFLLTKYDGLTINETSVRHVLLRRGWIGKKIRHRRPHLWEPPGETITNYQEHPNPNLMLPDVAVPSVPPAIAKSAKPAKPPRKRKVAAISGDADSNIESPATQKAQKTQSNNPVNLSPEKAATYSATELATLSQADLVKYAMTLQKQLDAKPTKSSVKELSPQELTQEIDHLRTLMEQQIRESMVWKATCKTRNSTFSQDFPVQSEQVFSALFKPVAREGEKTWRLRRFIKGDFEKVVGQEIRASVRDGTLVLTDNVIVHWNEDKGNMTCNGKYGKSDHEETTVAAIDNPD